MAKKKSGTSSRQETKAGAGVMAKLVDPQVEKYVRAMESPPEDWVGWTFPLPLRPLLDSPALEVIRVVFKDKGQLYLMMKKFIDDAKNGATRVHIIIFKSVPLDVVKDDMVWDYNIAPHCRFFYLEAQATLIMKIATETRMTEFFPMTKLKFDDTNMGVQGHALGRFKYGLKKQLSTMGIVDNRWEFACSKTRHSHGVIFDNNDTVQIKSIHSADRIFIPDINRHTKFDADHQSWPTMVIETGSDCANIASRFYLEYSADWWFTQSEGFTKIVIVIMFDYAHHATVIEKWVCASEAPYTKKLVQTITVFPKPNDKGKPSVIVQGEDLILEIESLMARPKREGESDIVFDKEFMKGFGNGFLLPWRNLGAKRENNLKSSEIDLATARKLLNYPLVSLKQQLGPALAEALKMAEKAAKSVGADTDVGASKMTLTLSRNKVSEKGKEKAVEEESSFGEDRIAVDITIGEAIAIMAEKEVVEEEK
ncbi:uncharacterized protein BHQ10_009142 [Talaromyces amestolkiae]|uniref:Uncharacterized protein n=1 Tax=Talaromyces amestolkiae TaxID=1196081 RepID=A0A364LBC3_TALAM|nr:uncharacterized protein BHQ10_009142 [Talaromyces amestolkiae]RAO73130.1 hypothetical protein BHQ10_009142 [Talaromyces amestolkiae]